MTEYLKWNGATLWQDDGSTPNYVLAAEKDLNGRVNTIETLGDRSQNLYRDTVSENRAYTVVIRIPLTAGQTLTGLKAAWDRWHSRALGEKVLERETETGNVLQLDAVAETPQWDEEGPTHAQVTQVYTAARPFWRSTSESNASANYNGAGPVNLACNNTGDLPSWARFVLDGAVEDPKIAYGDEWKIEFGIDLAAGDELALICRTPASAWYTPAAGPAEPVYGYRTFASSFRKAKLATGNHNLVLTATAGAGLATAYWYNLYESLQ